MSSLKLRVTSWNIGNLEPSIKDLKLLLDLENDYDIIALSAQEMTYSIDKGIANPN
eukprot:Pgem_evm1s16389